MESDLFTLDFTDDAFEDLDRFIEFSGNAAAAIRFVLNLIETTEILMRFPRLGRRIVERKGIRKLVEDPFIVYYQINERQKKVLVLRYWHGSQDGIPNFKSVKWN